MDITQIPKDELFKDKKESWIDIGNCARALSVGISTYSGGGVRDRLETNQLIIKKIDAEIERRSAYNKDKSWKK